MTDPQFLFQWWEGRNLEGDAMNHTDTERMDWLERNLTSISHDRASCSVDMSGNCVRGQLVNEARGRNAGPSYFRVKHRSIREAIDDAMTRRETR